ncbi:uncharacterized protein LOC135374602 [Ornithodoros turicata]|uniref:uncharacterized protein LOC135374602 n=1 Tax=Ornithodoros turicata TaxID=34597 RepID=UPI00313A2080
MPNTNDPERLRSKRGARRAQVTKLTNDAAAALQDHNTTALAIHVLLEKLIQCSKELYALDREVEEHTPAEDFDTDYASVLQYEEKITEYIAKLTRTYEQLQVATTSDSPPAVPTTIGSLTAPSGSGVKLQRLQLMKFRGDLAEWQPFWEQYKANIHENRKLSKRDKFHYLRSLLLGPAAAALSGLQTTEAAYDDAIALLTQRFGDKGRLERQYLEKLRTLPRVRSSMDTAALRRLYDYVQTNTCGLRSLGVPTVTYSSMMTEILLAALPPDLRLDYYRGHAQGETSSPAANDQSPASEDENAASSACSEELNKLLGFLKKEVESREKSGLCVQLDDKQRKQRATTTKGHAGTPSALALHSRTTAGLLSCIFCNEKSHTTETCKADVPLEDKKKALAKNRRCFRCTKSYHSSKECRFRGKCSKCGGRHVDTMCDPNWKPKPIEGGQATNASHTLEAPGLMTAVSHLSTVLLQTFRAWAVANYRCLYIRGIVDSGSSRTFIREDLAQELGLKEVAQVVIGIHTFASGSDCTPIKRSVVEVTVRSQYGNEEITLAAIVVPLICKDIEESPVDSEHVVELGDCGEQIADIVAFPGIPQVSGISLLVGSDQVSKLISGEIRCYGRQQELVAVKTKLGWTFQGPSATKSLIARQSDSLIVLRTNVNCMTIQDEEIRRIWEVENTGINENPSPTAAGNEVLAEFQRNIKIANGRYEVCLPWKHIDVPLRDNRDIAEKRLRRLVNRLAHDDELITEYDKNIRAYLLSGHAEPVPASGSKPSKRVYYMPHREVIRPQSTSTKMRVVFDASSHSGSCTSLNDHLEKGPKVQPDLLDVLIRFRMHSIGITADIEKAFLQISVDERDRDALRFLWFDHVPQRKNLTLSTNIVEWRMQRVPFGTSASPFLLAATLLYHFNCVTGGLQETAEVLASSFYVDDLLTGAADVESAIKLYREANDITEKAKMRLCKWASNCATLRDVFAPEEGVVPNSDYKTTKVLGTVWDKSEDTLSCSLDSILNYVDRLTGTKRNVLQAAARIYDPLGFLNPFTVRAKMLFQALWVEENEWDSPMSEDKQKLWNEWCSEIPELTKVSVDRCFLPSGHRNPQLHIFCDASPKGYGAVAYLRVENKDGTVTSTIVLSKSRVAPLKKLTLPRLELMAALIGSRMLNYLRRTCTGLDFDYFLWSDSMIALWWIRRPPSEWKQFVSNRVEEIQQKTDHRRWKHCPGTDNPADCLTRGMPARALVDSSTWWQGPAWLHLDSSSWPNSDVEWDDMTNDERSFKSSILQVSVSSNSAIMDAEKYSSHRRLTRVTAWVLRFERNVRCRNGRTVGTLTVKELNDADNLWVKQAQAEHFAEEVNLLQMGHPVASDSKLANLRPYLDDNGIIRLRTRLQCGADGEDVKCPIILPRAHHYTKLVVERAHHRTLHGGLQDTLNEVRERWWIPQGRQLTKALIFRCITCSRNRVKAASAPTAPLPSDRITPNQPFEVVGVDFAGPVMVRSERGSSKSYIALFTCATTRAVHFELVSDLTARSFLMAFRRFVSRRGLPNTVYSDNALTFKKACRDIQKLQTAVRQSEIQDYFASHQIKWKFIVERAAWWGGWWERLVRTTTQCLRKVLGRQSLTFEEMMTVLQDAEASINSRPLTYLHASPDEPAALTPAHLLIGRRLIALPSGEHQQPSSSATDLSRRWCHRQRIADHFWRRWHREYLLHLRSAHVSKPVGYHSLKEGDLALLHEDKVPRNLWKTVRIVTLHKGRDDKVRACTIKLPTGNVTRRPVQLLYPLEALLG